MTHKYIFLMLLLLCLAVSVSAQTRKCGKCGQAIPYAKVTDHDKICKGKVVPPKPATSTTKVCAQCRQDKALSSFSGKSSICNTCVQQNNRQAEAKRQAELRRQDEERRQAEAERQAEEKKRREFADKVKADMVFVESGIFMMGALPDDNEASDNEKPRHEETVSSFYISKYEVTQELWQAVMGSNASLLKGDMKRPVECVSWIDCQAFIRRLNVLTGENFRLPTEAEWEYAARGGQKSCGYLYSGSKAISYVAWYASNSGYTTHPVGQQSPNELGLYDMSGNVWEWCQDGYVDNSNSAQTNPKGSVNTSYRASRGGSWAHSAIDCRVSRFAVDKPDTRDDYSGLRLAL